ncbi:MAG: sigma-70 family RNA polymerase sigma factor [Victivallales bacterium]|nr:sigma-70 family RNA polymerase sigma factor [Victivallales bacterium]
MKKGKDNSKATSDIIDAIRPVSPDEVYANKGTIISVGKRLGWDYDSCDDLVQEVALKCWNDPRIRFNPRKGTVGAYLARIARNTAINLWRKNKHQPIPMEDVELFAQMDDKSIEMNDIGLRRKREKMLEFGIKELYRKYPSKDAIDAFVMFSQDKMPAKEVAEKIRVDERFVNVAVHRGVKRLKEIVNRLERDENWRDAS